MNMVLLKCIFIFQKKIFIPTLITSIILSFIGGFLSFKGVGFTFIVFATLFHYIIYEIRYPNEYYFYFNFGLSKASLWLSTLLMGAIICLIMNLL